MKHILLFCISLSCLNQLSAQRKQIRVKIHSITGYGIHEAFAQKAAAALEKVLNSPGFETRMKADTYLKKQNLTNNQLFDRIMSAHEAQGPGGEDGVIDLRIRTLRVDTDESNWKNNCQGSTIGIDGKGDGVTAICPNVLSYWAERDSVSELAAHYAHEYMHTLGFDHVNWLRGQKWREKTFVYKIGNLVAELIEEDLKKQMVQQRLISFPGVSSLQPPFVILFPPYYPATPYRDSK
jgi:hypothetical protein